jgi:hypothetical protein
MSTLTEIEAAAARLPRAEQEALFAHLAVVLRRTATERITELERANGVALLRERPGAPVTVETVRQLCAEEGI